LLGAAQQWFQCRPGPGNLIRMPGQRSTLLKCTPLCWVKLWTTTPVAHIPHTSILIWPFAVCMTSCHIPYIRASHLKFWIPDPIRSDPQIWSRSITISFFIHILFI
jgi:hypothetical protein